MSNKLTQSTFALAGDLDVRLSFGSADRLKKYLGVEPGSVTLFAIFNDPNQSVELIVDESLWHSEAFQFHPLVNTSTLVISRENLKRFIAETGHGVRLLDIPSLEVGKGRSAWSIEHRVKAEGR